jgi:mannose-1-phosphate guanylyltransferase
MFILTLIIITSSEREIGRRRNELEQLKQEKDELFALFNKKPSQSNARRYVTSRLKFNSGIVNYWGLLNQQKELKMTKNQTLCAVLTIDRF